MADVNISLNSRANLAGFQAAATSFDRLKFNLSRLNDAGVKLGIGFLSAQGAANLVKGEIAHVIENIENIPGIPQDTIDSINRAKGAFAESRNMLDQWIAKGVGLFTQIGEGLGYLAGAVVYGQEAANDAFYQQERQVQQSAEAAIKAKKAFEDQAAAAKKASDEQKAAAAFLIEYNRARDASVAAGRENGLIGETLGERVVRLRIEEESASQLAAALKKGTIEREQADEKAKRALGALRRAQAELGAETEAVQERIRAAEFERLSQEEKLLDLGRKLLAVNKSLSDLRFDDERQTDEQNKLTVQRLDLERQIADLKSRSASDSPAVAAGTGGYAYEAPVGISGGLDKYVEQAQTVQESLASGAYSIAQAFENGVGNAIEGLINQTMTWKQALGSIGQTILSSIVTAFAKMVAQYAASRLAMFILNKLFGAKETATSALQATASATAWAPAATAASIASFGAAAALGTAAFLSALGLGTAGAAAIAAAAGGAAVVGSRALGGPVASGSPYLVGEYGPEIVVPNESAVVMNHRETAAIASSLARGGSSGSGGGNGGGSSRGMTIVNVDSRSVAEQIRRNSDAQVAIIDLINQRRYEIAGV